MRILHITDFGPAGKINGVSEAVLNLAKAQMNAGAIVLVGHTRPNNYVKETFCYNVEDVAAFDALVSEFAPDIVVFNSFYDIKHPLFARKLKKRGIPYVITFHGGASKNNYKKHHLKKLIANALVFGWYVKSAAAVCYLNKGEMESSIFHRYNHNAIIIPNGIIFQKRNDFVKQTDGITITFMSRLDYYGKGLDILLSVIANIREWAIENKVSFLFYGYHYNDGTIEKIEELKDICSYRGFVMGNDKANAWGNTDIFILPSRSEGMPVSILEALSYGIPCIITPQTNMGDVIENNDCGWLTELDIDSLSNTIRDAVSDFSQRRTELQAMSINTSKQFSWNSIAQQSIDKYLRIIDQGNEE